MTYKDKGSYESSPPCKVAQQLEINFQNFQFSTRRTRILMGFIMHYMVLIVNPMGRILVRWKRFRNNLEMLCHPICNWLYRKMTYWIPMTYQSQKISDRIHHRLMGSHWIYLVGLSGVIWCGIRWVIFQLQKRPQRHTLQEMMHWICDCYQYRSLLQKIT